MSYEIGTKEKPMVLNTPPLTSEYTMHVIQKDGNDVLVCTVGKTVLLYNIDCLDDLHKMLKEHGDWMELGSADEQKPAKEGLRGRFGMYIPPLMEALGLAEVTHDAKGNKMRVK